MELGFILFCFQSLKLELLFQLHERRVTSMILDLNLVSSSLALSSELSMYDTQVYNHAIDNIISATSPISGSRTLHPALALDGPDEQVLAGTGEGDLFLLHIEADVPGAETGHTQCDS